MSGEGFLNNNDINATAVCIEFTGDDGVSPVVKVHPLFWEFVLSGSERVLKASKADVEAKTLVRLAFKSFELGIPFDNKDPTGKTIEAHVGVLYKSHVSKIEKMKEWPDSPFRSMKVEKKNNGFKLKPTSTKVTCSKCPGRANKSCKKTLCKKCCLEDESITSCAAHGKKPE